TVKKLTRTARTGEHEYEYEHDGTNSRSSRRLERLHDRQDLGGVLALGAGLDRAEHDHGMPVRRREDHHAEQRVVTTDDALAVERPALHAVEREVLRLVPGVLLDLVAEDLLERGDRLRGVLLRLHGEDQGDVLAGIGGDQERVLLRGAVPA